MRFGILLLYEVKSKSCEKYLTLNFIYGQFLAYDFRK